MRSFLCCAILSVFAHGYYGRLLMVNHTHPILIRHFHPCPTSCDPRSYVGACWHQCYTFVGVSGSRPRSAYKRTWAVAGWTLGLDQANPFFHFMMQSMEECAWPHETISISQAALQGLAWVHLYWFSYRHVPAETLRLGNSWNIQLPDIHLDYTSVNYYSHVTSHVQFNMDIRI